MRKRFFLGHLQLQRALLIIAALCSFALPNLVTAKQAAEGELLLILCTAEGKKAIGGAHTGHDCVQCCAGGTGAPPATSPAAGLHAGTHESPTALLPQAILNAPYLAPQSRGPPLLLNV
ncbi:MAG: hypothetical protein ACRCV9_11835 [Burkholderiaceae bacterium]